MENTLWANCVVASGSALGVVVYTGAETRSVMNNSQPRSKVGLLDIEINQLTKVSFLGDILISVKYLVVISKFYFVGPLWCGGRACVYNDVFKRFWWSLVPVYVQICFAVLLHHTN